ncbi:alcohol dehydrogenase GroES domain-containing protein [Gonapodya prolifera JEL478]|uniref:Alcohol dehydrogenase GroES domain-containing protein n=1 Tax=Gonapodya prolifera (strain JEL478) TaxID=1344416 RepID=A0A139B0K7_GONPJ|nr:alcohol dehydrogenase GroES domain-containing protein [Gonapodya prolifera JEL478]|eukprot:KXS22514.1 alcohol dehydrogenase GroES domain-containing protein [Gonapodya prolifera JEL478]
MTIPQTMKALVLHELGKPMTVEDVPVPKCGDNQVLVKIEASGVCHTDEFFSRAGYPGIKFPAVLGHEGAGTIAQIGAAVTGWKIGDRVSVPMYGGGCGKCYYCENDMLLQCADHIMHAGNAWGTYAEYIATNPKTIVAIPDNVSYEHAGPCGCAGVTVMGALRRSNAPKGSWVAYSGAGGLGLMGVQIAKAEGYKVLAIDVDDAKLEEAKHVGADAVLNAKTAGAEFIPKVLTITEGGLMANFIVTTAASAVENTIPAMKAGGSVIIIGIIEKPTTIPIVLLMVKDLKIFGSALGTVEDAKKVVKYVADGKVHPTTSPCKLSEVNHVFEELEKGTIVGRKVVTNLTQ